MDAALEHEVKKLLIQSELEEDMKTALFHNNLADNHDRKARTSAGLGQYKGEIPAQAYHYWGQRLGYQCWKDSKFVNEFFRDNPALAMKHDNSKPFFVESAMIGKKSFRKVY